jgi:TPR repeat protein
MSESVSPIPELPPLRIGSRRPLPAPPPVLVPERLCELAAGAPVGALPDTRALDSLLLGLADSTARRLEFHDRWGKGGWACTGCGAEVDETVVGRLLECAHLELGFVGGDGWKALDVARYGELAEPDAAALVGTNDARLDVLVAVATALATAHGVGWSHGRVSPSTVVLPASTRLQCEDVADSLAGRFSSCTKLVGFFAPGARCARCGGAGDGASRDVADFGHLLTWMYRGSRDDDGSAASDVSVSEYERRSRDSVGVPWPLLWIVEDSAVGKGMAMEAFLLYLAALQNKQVTPHGGAGAAMLQTGPSVSPSASATQSTLEACCARAAVVAMSSGVSEGALHVGALWEARGTAVVHATTTPRVEDGSRRSVGGSLAGSHVARECFRNAADCYDVAATLGDPAGFAQGARLQAAALSRPYYKRHGDTIRGMLRMVLRAAALGDWSARVCLALFPSRGVEWVSHALGGGASAELVSADERDAKIISTVGTVEAVFLDAVVDVAKCWRRGQAGLTEDSAEAAEWLRVARQRGHPAAALEEGLLGVQLSHSPEAMEKAVDLVALAANSFPSRAAVDACFWLAQWHRYNLQWRVPPPPAVTGSSVERQAEPGELRTAGTTLAAAVLVNPKAKAATGASTSIYGGGTDAFSSGAACLQRGMVPKIVVEANVLTAVRYARRAAEAGHPDACAMYAHMLRIGYGPVPRDASRARQLNRDARTALSGAAFYGHALVKIDQTRAAWSRLRSATIVNDTCSDTVSLLSSDEAGPRLSNTSSKKSGDNALPASRSFIRPRSRPLSRSATVSMLSQGSHTSPKARLVDDNGWLTAAGIVVNLENALSGLTGPSTRLAASMPVESTNPVPLILAAQRCILDNLEAWTVCSFDSSVGVETSAEGSASLRRRRDAFIAEKKRYALTLLQKAAHMHADPRWKELRVDYRQKDLDAMQDAKLKLNALKRVSAERTLPSVRPRTPRR